MSKRYGLVIDLERCIGCQTCTIACKVENGMETVSGIRVETVGGKYRDTPSGEYPGLRMYYLPVVCMHCEKPPCLDACPVEAIYKRTDGIVLIDQDKCDCCRVCLDACPYGAIAYDNEKHMVQKCNLCFERLDDGFEPFCVTCCGPEAIFYGDLADRKSYVYQLIHKGNAYVLKPELGTVPGVYYCPPKPPRNPFRQKSESSR